MFKCKQNAAFNTQEQKNYNNHNFKTDENNTGW